MTPRQAAIIQAAVREHIRTGEPVSSRELLARTRLPVSPATIRLEFSALEAGGFLSHPHVSAGRVPTPAGYRYYVDHCTVHARHPAAAARLRRMSRETFSAASEATLVRLLAHALAELSGTLAVVATQEPVMHEAGLGNLFRMREFQEDPDPGDVERLLVAIEERPEEVSALAEEGPAVFINGEHPLVWSRRCSAVIASPILATGSPVVVALIGPVRMPYERHLSVMETFYRVLHDPGARSGSSAPARRAPEKILA